MTGSREDVARLLLRWRQGEEKALDDLMPLMYEELRRLADRYMRRERADHTLQATALVHEAYLRLVGKDHPRWKGRTHFLAVAAQLMRRILIDHARRGGYAKRGGGAHKLSLEDTATLTVERAGDLIALDDALGALEAFDPRMKQVVELRFFGGLSIEETAEVLDLSPATVKREWRLAKAWLYAQLNAGSEGGA